MSKDPLSKIRAGDVYKQVVRVLKEFGVPDSDWSIVDKRPHPQLTVRYCGLERMLPISGTPSSRFTCRNEAANLRRLLKEMQMASLGAPASTALEIVAPAPLGEIGLHMIADQALVLDTELGERLGMARPTNIRQVIEANRAEIEAMGMLHSVRASSPMPNGGQRIVDAFYLTEEQALLVCSLSRAPAAAAIRSMLIRVFVAWRRGSLPARTGDIAEIVHREIAEILPKLIAEAVLTRSAAVVNMVPALTVIQWAGVLDRRGLRGLSNSVSNALRRFHADRGVTVQLASLASETRYVFDPATARQWLDEGGRRMIHMRAAERKGQLRLAVA